MALYTQLKHYIQPIMVVYGSHMFTRWHVAADEQTKATKITIGVLYALFYLVSSFGTKRSHKLGAACQYV